MDKSNEMVSRLNAMVRNNPELFKHLQACKDATEVARLITSLARQGTIQSSDKSIDVVDRPDLTDLQLERVMGGVNGEDVLMGFAKFLFVAVGAVAGVAEVVSPGTGRKIIQDVIDYKFSDER